MHMLCANAAVNKTCLVMQICSFDFSFSISRKWNTDIINADAFKSLHCSFNFQTLVPNLSVALALERTNH